MSLINGGALVGKALANEGIEKAFVLCGGHIMPIFYGMRNAGIEIIDMRHECAAIYAAIGYTRASGKPAVVVTTAGPGVANTIAGMMEAQSLGIPLLQIGGAVPMSQRDAGALQDMSTLNVMETCSKWARKVTSTARIPEYISIAFRYAMDYSSPGPVYLEMPTDIVHAKVEEEEIRFPVKYRTDAIPYGDPALIDSAAALLVNAKRPAALVDDGARFTIGNYAGAVAGLSDYLKMPVAAAGASCQGLFGDESENPLLGTKAMFSTNAIGEADVVLALGCRFDWRLQLGRMVPNNAKVIQAHTDMNNIGFNLRADIGIVGGGGPVASQLLAAVKSKRDKPVDAPWTGQPQKSGVASLPEAYRAEGIPVHPARCAGEVAKFLAEEGRDWTVVVDGGEASVWMGPTTTAHRPGQVHSTGANGTIGTGPALTIGAWVANRKPVLWYTGDGSFGFYAMEWDTIVKLGIPVVCVISNDSAWGMIRLEQKYYSAEEVKEKGQCHTELYHIRAYEKMTAMWDGYGEMVTDPEQVIPAIKRAVASGKPSIINVEVDQESLSPWTQRAADAAKRAK